MCIKTGGCEVCGARNCESVVKCYERLKVRVLDLELAIREYTRGELCHDYEYCYKHNLVKVLEERP